MLTPGQEKYIDSLPERATAHVTQFDSIARIAAEKLLAELQKMMPYAAIHYYGSTKLGLAGTNDIDIGVIAGERVQDYALALEGAYGASQTTDNGAVRRWRLMRDRFPVDLFLVERPTRRIQDDLDTHQILEARGDLRAAYERLKFSCKDSTLRDYTRKKFEFFNDILHPHSS
ncbi:GrpB family protein [Candidatus Kaiserbacteria bacterium]|nr:GrpB family protein [Candidatus Kaiserbacteria bacterium]